jgi:hypothetical protein
MKRYSPIKSIQAAWNVIGGLSFPSKMPCPGYSIPAETCITGSKLRQIAGTVCAICYACKGYYVFKATIKAMWRRYGALERALGSFVDASQWVDSFVTVLTDMHSRKGINCFRWHDSGDIQSTYHLHLLVAIADRLPQISFWLPTREYKLVSEYLKSGNVVPSNLCIRLSAHQVNGKGPAIAGLATSEVHTELARVAGTECQAYQNDGHCGDCRRCWDDGEALVSYSSH